MVQCRWCGKQFEKTSHSKIACSKKCAYLSYRHDGKSLKEFYEPKKCVYCGDPFSYNEQNKMQFSNMKTCGKEECSRELRYLKIPDNRNFNPKAYDKILIMRKRLNKISNDRKKSIKDRAYRILGNKCFACDFKIVSILQPHHLFERNKKYRDQIQDLKKAMDEGTLKGKFVLVCPNHHALHTYLKIPIKELYRYK